MPVNKKIGYLNPASRVDQDNWKIRCACVFKNIVLILFFFFFDKNFTFLTFVTFAQITSSN